jgi:hypothetical protein
VKVIFDGAKLIVAPLDPTPLTLKTLVNQIVRPEAMAVPLKFDGLETAVSAEATAVDLDPPCSKDWVALSRWQACESKPTTIKERKNRRVA